MKLKNYSHGFTLIELLVVIAIISILTAISVFALSGSRESARDVRRKADLEQLRSALEIYRADCNRYPASLPAVGSSLTANPSAVNCAGATNTYIQAVPGDPTSSGNYRYCVGAGNNSYTLSTYLEDSTATVTACGACSGGTCRYQITSP
jgi:general secretion pathway protein G